ncbi:MAG: hypothetical protein Rhims3KO_27670 [Hyphomicrobiales bacterium]
MGAWRRPGRIERVEQSKDGIKWRDQQNQRRQKKTSYADLTCDEDRLYLQASFAWM